MKQRSIPLTLFLLLLALLPNFLGAQPTENQINLSATLYNNRKDSLPRKAILHQGVLYFPTGNSDAGPSGLLSYNFLTAEQKSYIGNHYPFTVGDDLYLGIFIKNRKLHLRRIKNGRVQEVETGYRINGGEGTMFFHGIVSLSPDYHIIFFRSADDHETLYSVHLTNFINSSSSQRINLEKVNFQGGRYGANEKPSPAVLDPWLRGFGYWSLTEPPDGMGSGPKYTYSFHSFWTGQRLALDGFTFGFDGAGESYEAITRAPIWHSPAVQGDSPASYQADFEDYLNMSSSVMGWYYDQSQDNEDIEKVLREQGLLPRPSDGNPNQKAFQGPLYIDPSFRFVLYGDGNETVILTGRSLGALPPGWQFGMSVDHYSDLRYGSAAAGCRQPGALSTLEPEEKIILLRKDNVGTDEAPRRMDFIMNALGETGWVEGGRLRTTAVDGTPMYERALDIFATGGILSPLPEDGQRLFEDFPPGTMVINQLVVSSQLTEPYNLQEYNPRFAFDGDPKTMWFESKPGGGRNEYLSFTTEEPRWVDEIRVRAGSFWSEESYYDNFRIKDYRLEVNNVRISGTLEDVYAIQSIKLIRPIPLKTFKFIIRDVYLTNKWEDTPINDLWFYFRGREIPVGLDVMESSR
jgi:hypothetical protein